MDAMVTTELLAAREIPSFMINLTTRVQLLRNVVDIIRGWDPEVAGIKAEATADLLRIKENLKEIKSIFERLQICFNDAEEEKRRSKYLQAKILYVLNNIPDRFNLPSNSDLLDGKPTKLNNSSNDEPSDPSDVPVSKVHQCVPEIFFLTIDEFDKVPKYIKGRTTYDKVNAFIEVINKVISQKYAVFKKKRSTLKKRDADLWNEYNKQELKETKGLYFCVANDFKNLHGSILDKTSLNMLTILRHCGRIREVRTGGILRYVVVPSTE